MADALKKPKGQSPAWYDDDVKDEMFHHIVGRMANGENLIAVFRNLPEGYPKSAATFLYWVSENPEYANQYARAMKVRADIQAEDILNIAETEPNQFKARNMIDARKWHNAKSQPKKYGDKVLQESNINVTARTIDSSLLSQEVRDQLRAALAAQLEPPTIDITPEDDE